MLSFIMVKAQMNHSFDNGLVTTTENAWAGDLTTISVKTGGNTGSYCEKKTVFDANHLSTSIFVDVQKVSVAGTTGLRVYILTSDAAHEGFHLHLHGPNGAYQYGGFITFTSLTNGVWGVIDIPWSSIAGFNPVTFQLQSVEFQFAQDAAGTSPATVGIDDIQYYGGTTPPPSTTVMIHSFDNGFVTTTENAWAGDPLTIAIKTGGNAGSYCEKTTVFDANHLSTSISVDAQKVSVAGTTGLRVYILTSDAAHEGLHLHLHGPNGAYQYGGFITFTSLTNGVWGAVNIPWTSIAGFDPVAFQIQSIELQFAQDAAGTSPATVGIDDIQYYGLSTGISNLVKNDNLTVYPNPVTNGVVNLSEEAQQISIYNCQGALVKSIQKAKTINVSELQSGVYFITTSKGHSTLFINN